MKTSGQVVVFRFPQTDQSAGKLRPALLVSRVPGPFDDWLVCMITSQLRHQVDGFDEVVRTDDEDFGTSGLKSESLIRIGRVAVVDGSVIVGAIGEVSPESRTNQAQNGGVGARRGNCLRGRAFWLCNKRLQADRARESALNTPLPYHSPCPPAGCWRGG